MYKFITDDKFAVASVTAQKMREITEYQLTVMKNPGSVLFDFSEINDIKTPDLIIDSVLGYSLGGPPIGNALDFIAWMNNQPIPILSLDVPSGIDATTGESPG